MENKEILKREKTTAPLKLNQKQAVKWRIHDLFLEGLSGRDIYKTLEESSEIKISYRTVTTYINEIIDEQNERREQMTDRAYTVAFMKVEGLERKAHSMLKRSEENRTKKVTKTRNKGAGDKATTETETIDEVLESVGDIRILEFLRQCNRDRLEILRNGKFNAPEETTQAFVQQNNFYNFDVGYRAVPMEPIKNK